MNITIYGWRYSLGDSQVRIPGRAPYSGTSGLGHIITESFDKFV